MSKYDYLMRVKGNQKNLYKQIQEKSSTLIAVDKYESFLRTRDREETRRVFLYNNLTGISKDWVGLKWIIKVERIRIRKGHTHHIIAYYISSLEDATAEDFHGYIRDHWGIENRLHWVKDVCMKEDKSRTIGGMAAENLSLIRNIGINLFRANGFDSIKYATEKFANNVIALLKLTKNCKPKQRI